MSPFLLDASGGSRLFDDGQVCSRPHEVSNPWLAALPGDQLALLYRVGIGPGSAGVHYVRFGPDLEPTGPPVLIGRIPHTFMFESGFQPRAVAIGEDRFIWSERADDSVFRCAVLSRMRIDASDRGESPWQFDCVADMYHVTRSHELLPIEDGLAVAVWGERHSTPMVTSRHDGIWFERINLAMLGPEGRRASEIVRVTSDASTTLDGTPRTETTGPSSGDFVVAADTLGNEVVVAWRDLRSDGPGIYARRFVCERDTP